MNNDATDNKGAAGKPIIAFYDRNPLVMLDLELSLRDLLGDNAHLYALTHLSELAPLALNGDVVLFLLDGKLHVPAYAPLEPADPRIVYVVDRPESGKQHIERHPSRFSLSQLPAISRILTPS
jgi:hypothetical protein